ncbi:hypothetical protein SAMN04488583_0511 [Mycobacterium sp. 88mf]|nr:hypothetical protein [Mycolicibacterium septicum]SEP61428.1 hypothetical protein SAMN04488583_0511 [Mycobacterium sp. 88mf]SFF06052.1 hypothetical protein SAMN04488582_10185 [Mycobacterium sp. 455mf]
MPTDNPLHRSAARISAHTAVIDKLCERHLPEQFRTTFNAALTQGKDLGGATDLGPFTRAAIARVAADHPEATCEIIAATYEVFRSEHGL